MPPVKKTVGSSHTTKSNVQKAGTSGNSSSGSKAPSRSGTVRKSDAEKAKQRAFAEQRRLKQEKQKRAERKKKGAYYGAILLLSLIGFALFLVIFIGALVLDFHRTPSPVQYTLTVTDASAGQDGAKEEPYSVTERDGNAYVSVAQMAKGLSLLSTGDAVVRTLHFGDGTAASFYVGTPYVLVGGQSVTLAAPSFLSADGGSDVFVPYEFFPRCVSGVTFGEEHRKSKTAYTMRIDGPVGLIMSDNMPLTRPMNGRSGEAGAYLTDVAAYEVYIDPEDADAYLTLVNHTHPVTNTVPDDLTAVADTRYDRDPVMMRECAAKALEAMFLEMRANGFFDMSVTEGYVSYDEQAKLYNRTYSEYLNDYGEADAAARTRAHVAEAGCSENILGLSADMHNLPSASQAFEAEAAYKWLYANCAEFGFILRYPKNKSEITGFAFEPYHFRFVGRTHARRIMADGLCLEEYVGSLASSADTE